MEDATPDAELSSLPERGEPKSAIASSCSDTSNTQAPKATTEKAESAHYRHAPPGDSSWPHPTSTASLVQAPMTTAPAMPGVPAEGVASPRAETTGSAPQIVEALSVALLAALGVALVTALWIYVFQLATTASRAFRQLAKSTLEANARDSLGQKAQYSQLALAVTTESGVNETGSREGECRQS